MDQRRLRLGDILDDYCPRERRVTNHAVVAMIEDEVKQTRCTTCDAEHVYKGGRAPKRRKAETPAALYKEVLAAMPDQESTPALAVTVPDNIVDLPETPTVPVESVAAAPDDQTESDPLPDEQEEAPRVNDEPDGPVHRQLLRAKLPRPEGQKDSRPVPEFTVRQAGNRGNGFRGDRSKMRGAGDHRTMGRGNGGPVNGNRAHGGGGRFQNARPGGQHRGPGGRGGSQTGFRGGQPRHGGKKGRG
ncbi:MAG: hypothetical protein WBC51_27690 [Vicinamibacterales bacterium]